MKKLFLAVIIVIGAWIPSVAGAEQINDYSATITVNKDASINVEEKIQYFFDEQRHGIFRDIPYKYKRDGFNYNLRISDISVKDETGAEYTFDTSRSGGNLSIKIGDAELFVIGTKNYYISYRVERALNYFDDHDELYWNAVGTGWDVPIVASSATVILPPEASGKITKQCFSGPYGSADPCDSSSIQNNSVLFSQGNNEAGEGLTIVVGFPTGIVYKPTTQDKILSFIRDNYFFVLPVIGAIVMYWIWRKKGKDPVSKIPVTAQYEAPENLTPIEVGYLMDERNQNAEVTAEIIYLATLGYLKIERIPKTGWFGKDDFKLIKLKENDGLKTEFDKNLLTMLFETGNEVLLSNLKKEAKLKRSDFNLKIVAKKMVSDGYYDRNPNNVRAAYMTFGAITIWVLLFFVGAFLSWSVLIPMIILLIVVIVFGYIMPKKTQKGADTRQLILGLKEYLSVAEKDRLDFHNDPAKDPKVFEKLLPFAMALGVSKQWSQKFEGLYQTSPAWYSDPSHTTFNASLLHSSVGDFGTGFQSMVMTSSSAGSGGSGFSGGGSGGGGGGGGGGSW